jgi:hypothetical protein
MSQSASLPTLPPHDNENHGMMTTPPSNKTRAQGTPTKSNTAKPIGGTGANVSAIPGSASSSVAGVGGGSSWKRLMKKPLKGKGTVSFSDDIQQQPPQQTRGTTATSTPASSTFTMSTPMDEEKASIISEDSLLQPILSAEKRRVEISSRLKPRPSVLFNDKLSTDNFVPGADPKNFFEQDRKLGYQKPRMWFPTPQLDVSNSLIAGKTSGGSSQVVEEYLRMKALASYVGDLVIPKMNSTIPGLKGTTGFSPYDTILAGKNPRMAMKQRYTHVPGKDLTDPVKYANALSEAMQLWSPILGVHKPSLAKKRSYNLFLNEDNNNGDERREDGSMTTTRKYQRVFYEETVRLSSNQNDEYGLIPTKRSVIPMHDVF